jgi:aryl-alcohol dehydrogenase-like predicted oxidoreductase
MVVSLAWLLRRSPVTLPIPGTSNAKHLEENMSAAAFRLTDAEFAELAAVVTKPYWLRG